MKVWTDKEGNKLDAKEFMSRWKDGINAVTPLQNTYITLIGHVIILIGIALGIVINLVYSIWWLFIILIGSAFVSGMSFIATLQRYRLLKQINEQIKEVGL